MNRNILVLVVVGILVVMLGVIGFALVWYSTNLPAFVVLPGIKPKEPPPATPFTLAELEDLLEKPGKAAESIPRLVSCFWTDDEGMRAQASEVLKKVGAKAVDPLRAQLKVKIPAVRFWIVQTLGAIGPDAASAADDLLACMQDEDAEVRYKAVYAVGRVGVKTDKAVAALLKALEDREESVTETALAVLDEMGAPPKEALPTLSKLSGKEAPASVRQSAIKLLGKMGESAVPTLRDLLKQSAPEDQPKVIHAISLLGPGAKTLLPALRPILILETRSTPSIDPALIEIFKKCGSDGAKGLADALKSVDGRNLGGANRPHLLMAIGAMGSQAEVAVPILIELLNSKKPHNERERILETLGDIGPAANAAIPAVEALLDEPAIAGAARIALRRMGKIDKKG